MNEVETYSDQELRERLTALGFDVGPIVDSTRKLYQKKLAQLLFGPEETASGDSPSFSQEIGTSEGNLDQDQATRDSPPPNIALTSIRARQPISRTQQPKELPHTSHSSVFSATGSQIVNNSSSFDHIMKFACFIVVILVVVYFITNQNAGNALESRPKQ